MKLSKQKIQFPLFKISCSQIGKIMTNARATPITEKQLATLADLEAKKTRTDKQTEQLAELIAKRDQKEELSETAKAYAIEYVKEAIYGRRKTIESRYLTKGNMCEDDAILYALGAKYKKNIDHFENDFMSGTPDIITDTTIIDIKNSWDCFSFPLFSQTLPTEDYYYQLQGYMHLTGRKNAQVVYTLMDLPDELIEKEYWRTVGVNPYNEDGDYTPEFGIFAKDYKYAKIKKGYRVKKFSFAYDPEVIKKIENRVLLVREFIGKLTI